MDMAEVEIQASVQALMEAQIRVIEHFQHSFPGTVTPVVYKAHKHRNISMPETCNTSISESTVSHVEKKTCMTLCVTLSSS